MTQVGVSFSNVIARLVRAIHRAVASMGVVETWTTRTGRVVTTVFLAVLFALNFSTTAFAHAVLMDSAPKAGAQLEAAPNEVSVTFNENVGPIFFKVLD